jgi:hypothetical protein
MHSGTIFINIKNRRSAKPVVSVSAKLNLHFMFEVSATRFNTCSQTATPLTNCFGNNCMVQLRPLVHKSTFQFINASDGGAVNFLLHDAPDTVVNGIQVWRIWWPKIRWYEVWCLPAQQLQSVASTVCWRAILLEHKTVTRNMSNVWQKHFHQHNITVVFTINLHPRFQAVEFCTAHSGYCNRDHDRFTERGSCTQ